MLGFVRRAAITLFALSLACSSTPAPLPSPTLPSLSETPSTTPPPRAPAPASVAVIGDWGSGRSEQRMIAEAMCRSEARGTFGIVVTTGDNFYDPDGTATSDNFHDPMRCLLQADVAWRASWGNHDQHGESTKEVLGASRWYRWRWRGAEFFMLDSSNVGNAQQTAWLEERLAASTSPIKIVVFHHPPYTVGSVHDPDQNVQREWVPFFRRFGVALVLTGHNHIYEHHVVDGIDYVVTGGGGQRLYGCARSTPELVRCDQAHHFLLLTITKNGVRIRAVRANGTTLDQFDISA